jgi:hypothetical protein
MIRYTFSTKKKIIFKGTCMRSSFSCMVSVSSGLGLIFLAHFSVKLSMPQCMLDKSITFIFIHEINVLNKQKKTEFSRF